MLELNYQSDHRLWLNMQYIMNLEQINECFLSFHGKSDIPRLGGGCSVDFFDWIFEDEIGFSFTDGSRIVFDGDNNVQGTKYLVFLT